MKSDSEGRRRFLMIKDNLASGGGGPAPRMSERVDFSANASIYDRRHGTSVSDDGLHSLWLAAGLHEGARVLDIGAGTGRVAIPLAVRGCRVAAVEPASGMLAQLRAKDGEVRVQAI